MQSVHPRYRLNWFITVSIIILAAGGCRGQIAPTATPALPAHTSTPVPVLPTPTPTSPPAAAVVNGEVISLADFQAELGRYQAAQQALGKTISADDAKKTVIDELIDQALLAQAARQAGFQVDDATLQNRLDQVIQGRGGNDGYQKYLSDNGYTDASFRTALRLAIIVAWERDQVIAQVPANADQVHARQILVFDEATANDLYAKLQAGADFATLALQIDPVTGGELGWFPKGFLTVKEVEDAAFSLQAGQYSPVIHTRLGYHIVQVIERDPNHALEPNARSALQRQYLQDWLKGRRDQSSIQLSLP